MADVIGSDTQPNPGSNAAIAAGCTCPVLDNEHGLGIPRDGRRLFWIAEDCPLHGCGRVALTQAQLERLAQCERLMEV